MKVSAITPILVALITCQSADAGFVSDWHASSGLLPEQISPPYAIVSTGDASHSLSGDALTISTTSNSSLLDYTQSGTLVDTSQAFYIEARLKLGPGGSSSAARGQATIGFTSSSGTGNNLWIDQGKVFFNTGQLVPGPVANVDTTNAFHTYRIEYDGNGGIGLLYDGSLILSSHTYTNINDFGSGQRIEWGDGSLLASGTSQWQYVQHNALVAPQSVPEPSTILLVGVGVSAVTVTRRFRNRWREVEGRR